MLVFVKSRFGSRNFCFTSSYYAFLDDTSRLKTYPLYLASRVSSCYLSIAGGGISSRRHFSCTTATCGGSLGMGRAGQVEAGEVCFNRFLDSARLSYCDIRDANVEC